MLDGKSLVHKKLLFLLFYGRILQKQIVLDKEQISHLMDTRKKLGISVGGVPRGKEDL